jgi:hypothetical protein
VKQYPPPADAWIHYGGEGKTYRDHIAAGEDPAALRKAWSKQTHKKKKHMQSIKKMLGDNRDMCSIPAESPLKRASPTDAFRALGDREKLLVEHIALGKAAGAPVGNLEDTLRMLRAERLSLTRVIIASHSVPSAPIPAFVGVQPHPIPPQVLADIADWAKGNDQSATVVVELAREVPGAEKIEEPVTKTVVRKFKSSRRRL